MTARYLDFERMKHAVSQLVQKGEELSQIEPDVYYSARKWTPIKLKLLMDYVHMYSVIMKTHTRIYSRFIYVDPLAGAGINRIEDTGDLIAGSPLISVVSSENLFEKYFFAEADAKKRKALQARLEKLLPLGQFEIKEDCNNLLDYVSELLAQGNKKLTTYFLLIVKELK